MPDPIDLARARVERLHKRFANATGHRRTFCLIPYDFDEERIGRVEEDGESYVVVLSPGTNNDGLGMSRDDARKLAAALLAVAGDA